MYKHIHRLAIFILFALIVPQTISCGGLFDQLPELHSFARDNNVAAITAYHGPVDIWYGNAGTPFWIAVAVENIDAAKALLTKGADLQFDIGDGMTYLHVAAQNGWPHMIEPLIKLGANFNAQNDSGKTALHIAAYQGFADHLTALLQAGAKPNICDNEGMTPLHYAALTGYSLCAIKLMIAGARWDLPNTNEKSIYTKARGKTALEIAQGKTAEAMMQCLELKNAALALAAINHPRCGAQFMQTRGCLDGLPINVLKQIISYLKHNY